MAQLDPSLLDAIQDAARAATAQGVHLRISSGWRSKGFQQRLFDDAVGKYGSVEIARQFVASPDVSKHVVGQAVDVSMETPHLRGIGEANGVTSIPLVDDS
jgi:LAS superfamily LD-carboxypeptidase LdcB